MATPLFRVNYFYQDILGKGWSETFFCTLTDYTSVMDRAKMLAPLLINLRGTGVNQIEIRVSDDNVKRDSLVYVAPTADQTTGFPGFEAGEFSDACLLIRMSATPQYRRPLYLAGVPAMYIVNNGQWVPGSAWQAQYQLFVKEMFSGNWGLKNQVIPGSTNPITTFVGQGSTPYVTFGTSVAHGFVEGTLVNIKGYRGALGLNGRHVVQGVPSLSSFTINSTQFNVQPKGIPYVYPITYALTPFTNLLQERIVRRKRGRPFDASRGRHAVL